MTEVDVASIALLDESLVVSLSVVEKLGALHGDMTIPRSGVRSVRSVVSPLDEVRGIRSPGTGVPWLIALGTYRTLHARDFVAAYRAPGVVVELTGQRYHRLVVSTPNAEQLVAAFAV